MTLTRRACDSDSKKMTRIHHWFWQVCITTRETYHETGGRRFRNELPWESQLQSFVFDLHAKLGFTRNVQCYLHNISRFVTHEVTAGRSVNTPPLTTQNLQNLWWFRYQCFKETFENISYWRSGVNKCFLSLLIYAAHIKEVSPNFIPLLWEPKQLTNNNSSEISQRPESSLDIVK